MAVESHALNQIYVNHLLIVPFMAKSFEYPPAFVAHRSLSHDDSSAVGTMMLLCHHFFLTRLKKAVIEVFRLEYTSFLHIGLAGELVNYLHYYCFSAVQYWL